MVPTKLDHCVIHVSDWERSNKFYSEVMGAELVQRPAGWAYRFGDKQLNVHGPGVKPAEVARLPVQPGNSDLCFEWEGSIESAIAHLKEHGIPIERGPIQRFGAKGPGTSCLLPRPGRLVDGIYELHSAAYNSAIGGDTLKQQLALFIDAAALAHRVRR
jgi:catechol 2,3-dioxygenase-like lactoylglutathione lyase family enzyme